MKTTNTKSRYLSILLIVTVIFTMCFGMTCVSFAADQMDPADQKLTVNSNAAVTVKAYNSSYTYNTYVSIRDVAKALNGTAKQFNVVYDEANAAFDIQTNTAYTAVGDENKAGTGETLQLSSTVKGLTINGDTVKYYVYKSGNDFYIKLVDLCLALNLDVTCTSANTLNINTAKDFIVDINQLDSDGYFSFLHGVVLGNATTGEILYECKSDNKVAIASTTKLMTYLLVMEAVDSGKISMNDTVTLSKAVEAESHSEDAVIPMQAGQKASMQDLLEGMLVPSSNECALALAEHVAGSEAAFVKMMNDKAKALGMTSVTFYNPHGLPNYTLNAVTSKRQNSMNAKDMFTLASYILKNYPQITEITAKPAIDLKTLNYQDTNTNPLLYNMDGIIGLKTGTTNRAGACLVSALPINVNGQEQTIIAVELGAEGSAERGEKSAVLMTYAQQYYAGKAAAAKTDNYVELRKAAEAKGYKIEWTGSKKPIVLTKDDMRIELNIGSTAFNFTHDTKDVKALDQITSLSKAVKMENNKTMVVQSFIDALE